MNRNALRILARVAKEAEVSLDDAIRMGHKRGDDHRNQYPLALLLEEHYLGMTISYTPPDGFDLMREFALAITLHMYLLPADTGGVVSYLGIRTAGMLEPKKERVFLTQRARCISMSIGRNVSIGFGRLLSDLRRDCWSLSVRRG
jgi:hypothetical protein